MFNNLDVSVCRKESRLRSIQHFILVWLDSHIDESDQYYQDQIIQLRRMVNLVHTCTESDECIDFIEQITNDKVFLIVSDEFIQNLLPRIHENKHLESIYIFCNQNTKQDRLMNQWKKIKDDFIEFESLYESLKQDIRQCNRDLTPISIASPSNGACNRNLNELDQSFMYSQLLKEILLNIEYDANVKQELVDYCLPLYQDNKNELNVINEFEKTYHRHTPIWWYTRECFTYSMLNRALRTQNIEIIIKMGFFLQDLHKQIEQIHSTDENFRDTFMVYRGQGIFSNEFEKLKLNIGGLLAFNNFLSTSTDRQVSLEFAVNAQNKDDMVAVLFEIEIHPMFISVPFAQLNELSYYGDTEKEILFSIHAVFRISDVVQIDKRLWKIKLKSTADSDPQLKILTECLRNEIQGSNSWEHLGQLMITMGVYEKAEEIYETLINAAACKEKKNIDELANYYHQLGSIKSTMGDHRQALAIYEKSLELQRSSGEQNQLLEATIYNSIGLEYEKMGSYSAALAYFEKVLAIRSQCLSSDHLDMAGIYNNLGLVYHKLGNHSNGMKFLQKALKILEKKLPSNHPDISSAYNNIASVYEDMQQYPTALTYYQKTLSIELKTLTANHPDLATTYNNMAGIFHKTNAYSKALSFYEKSVVIYEKSLTSNHPNLANTYSNMGVVYRSMGNFQVAQSFYERAIHIGEQCFPSNHPFMKTLEENLKVLQAYRTNES